MKKIGFMINPIAGMGGRVGLKGTDGMADEAKRLGAEPISTVRANEMLGELLTALENLENPPEFRWLTCSHSMGEGALRDAGFRNIDVAFTQGEISTPEDTKAAASAFVESGADLIVFCGGDGTARDICQQTGTSTPILGIPSGVKMYSGVFGVTPMRTADLLLGFLRDELDIVETEILDLDEESYRQGAWVVRLYYAASTPFEPTLTQATKAMFDEHVDADIKCDIAQHIVGEMESNPHRLYILGPGGTTHSVGQSLNIDKTLLGIDVVLAGKLVARDVNEQQLLGLLSTYDEACLVLSPIGAQGFVLGRGNLQLSPAVISKVGRNNIRVIATPAKLAQTPALRFDTGDPALDAVLAGDAYWPVIIGYHKQRMVRVSR
jgi:predicted polyphosphate/ATP-dependent NAD kinase